MPSSRINLRQRAEFRSVAAWVLFVQAILVLTLAGCGGTSKGGSGAPNPDPSDQSENASVLCLRGEIGAAGNRNISTTEMKALIGKSALAILKCKSNEADIEAYLK